MLVLRYKHTPQFSQDESKNYKHNIMNIFPIVLLLAEIAMGHLNLVSNLQW